MKARWFLVGVIVTLFFGDWLRMKVEREELLRDESKAQELAEARIKAVASCNKTLNDVKVMLSNYELRAQIAVLARAQSLDLFTRAKKGDQQAKEMLMDLGLDPTNQPDAFERLLDKPTLALRRK